MLCTRNDVQRQLVKTPFQPFYSTLCTLTEKGEKLDENTACKIALGKVIVGKLGRKPDQQYVASIIDCARTRAQEFIDNIPTLQSKVLDRVATEILCLVPSAEFDQAGILTFRILESREFTGIVHKTASTQTVGERINSFTDEDILGMF